jgi:hypothetical protein
MLFDHRSRKKLGDKQEFVLVPILLRDSIEIQPLDRVIHRVNKGTG